MSILDFAIDHVRHNRSVFPGTPGAKTPAIKNPFESATLNELQIIRWWKQNPLYNICLPAGTEIEPGFFLVVIDIDRKISNGFDTEIFLADLDRVFPPTLTQITAGNGEHRLYMVPFLPGNGVGLIGPGIDHRGFRGYYMGAGSWCNGKEYVYKNNLAIQRAPQWLDQILNRRPAGPAGPKALQMVTNINQERALKQGVEFINALPSAREGERNDKAYKAACELKNIGLENASAVALMSTNLKTDTPLGLIEVERTVNSAYKNSKGAFGEKSQEAFDIALKSMCDEYSICRLGGNSVVLHHTRDEEEKPKTDVLSVDSFHIHHANNLIPHKGKDFPLSRIWIKSQYRKTYQGMIFSPKYIGAKFFNLWQGFAVKPLTEAPSEKAIKSLENFKTHIIQNVAQNNIEHANWLFTWFAHIFQKPGEKPRTGLVLRGKKGVGKSAIFDCISKLLGDHYLSVSGRRYITGNFNAHLEGKLLYVLEEAFWANDKNADSILKSLVTDDHVQIERKGKDSYSTRNLCRIVVIGNAPWLVDASVEERRYAVFEVTDGNKGDDAFFGSMKEEMDPRLLIKFFMEFDLSKANINRIPQTKELRAQKQLSGEPFEQWWDECMIEGSIDEEWPESIPRNWLHELFTRAMKERQVRGPFPSCNKIDQFFRKAQPSIKCSNPRTTVTRQRIYILPTIEIARKDWDTYMGQEGDYSDAT